MALKYRYTASEIYKNLGDLIISPLPIRKRYQQLNELFHQLLEQSIDDAPIQLSGTFAMVDYLVRKHKIPFAESILIHDTRRILHTTRQTKEKELTESWKYDVKSVALFAARVLGERMPSPLLRLLPSDNRTHRWEKVNEHLVRCIVIDWDTQYIRVREEQNGTDVKVCYDDSNRYLTRNGKADWSYLQKIMRKGTLLNLLRVRVDEDVFFPELIIFEPDYLVNVTTIASCFETYSESPFVNLINKVRPQSNNQYIHLGNLSGMFLDDTVHQRKTSFSESWKAFMQANMLALLSCPDFRSPDAFADFCNEARTQQQNIEKLIGHDLFELPHIEDYDQKEIILEPTFFSPALGIQGRFDFLLETHKEDATKRRSIIIEQKSGKGEFVTGKNRTTDKDVPVAKEQHLVQINLYRALFHYEYRKHEGQLEYIMLLYSKYEKGLVSLGNNLPELLLRAIRIRNLLTWCEMHYCEDGMKELHTITPEKLLQKTISEHLWRMVRPQIEAVISPLHSASELEQAYVMRFLQFVAKEQMLAKIGNRTRENSGFASKWLLSLDEKIAAGEIFDRMTIEDFVYDDERKVITGVKMRLPDEPQNQNFRRGDIIILYNYRKEQEPIPCAQMVTRCSIEDISARTLVLSLRNPQTDARAFRCDEDSFWAVEHDLYDSSSNAMYSSIYSFLSAPQSRRDLVLSRRSPEVDETVQVQGDSYGNFQELVRRAKQARELFLVIGPPGTGKTSYGLLYQLQEQLLEPDTNILLLSFTNRAVDEICSKLVESNIDFIRIGSPLTCDPMYHNNLFSTRSAQCERGSDAVRLINTTRVFCGTTSAFCAHPEIFTLKQFDLAIVDEASQILEPHLLGILSAQHNGNAAISKFVLIGDHKQLPAVVQQTQAESEVTDEQLRDIGLTNCRNSFFERMLNQFHTKDGYDPRFVFMLTRQGRMHRDIAEFPNLMFYGGKLDVVPLHHQLLPSHTSRLSFIASSLPEDSLSPKVNTVEATIIADIVQQIYKSVGEHFSVEKTIGIIVPYRNQIATIRNAIDAIGVPKLHDIAIDTVERYQGSQRDYIIYGFTVQHFYQLNFLESNVFEEDGMLIDRKLNVAMTRARLNLIMVGNPQILGRSPIFSRLIQFVKSNGGYSEA